MPLPTRAKAGAARREPSRCAAPFAPPRTSSTSWGGARGRGGTALGEVIPESLSPGARRAARDALVERRVEDRPARAPRGPGKLGRGNRLHADVRVTLSGNRLRGELVPRGFSRVRKVHDTRDPLFEELADCPRDIGRVRGPRDLVVHDREVARAALDLPASMPEFPPWRCWLSAGSSPPAPSTIGP